MVWGKDNRVLYPALLCLVGCVGMHTKSSLHDLGNNVVMSAIACGIGALVSVAQALPSTSVFESEPLITALFVMTLFTNLSCTSQSQTSNSLIAQAHFSHFGSGVFLQFLSQRRSGGSGGRQPGSFTRAHCCPSQS